MNCPLVPIDGSENSLRALAHAMAELRDRSGGQLHVLNVQPLPIHPWPGKLLSPDLIEQELRHRGDSIVQAAVAAARKSGVSCTSHVRIGHAAHEIAGCAVQQHCDAIVMGTRGVGRVAGIVLGSVAHSVVHLATVPVTLVK
jgi:nucleotide-binding universal stress UspA family protein